MTHGIKGDSTKQRILDTAATLFAEKGFTETSIRELIDTVGLKNPASLYYYFPSKNAILEQMLDDYSAGNISLYDDKVIAKTLRKNPTIDGILACMQTSFPKERAEYYLKILCVMLQEQLRNSIAREYISKNIILRAEQKVRVIIETLKELGVLRPDTDYHYWMRVTSSLSYSFAARMMLGIGDNAPGYTGLHMADMLRFTFETMLQLCGTAEAGAAARERHSSR